MDFYLVVFLYYLFSNSFHHSPQFATHFTKQTDAVTIRVKKRRSARAMIAPKMLVAAKVTARRIKAVNEVPKIPAVTRLKLEQMQS